MFNLLTRRGRFSAAGLVAIALTLAACPGSEPSPGPSAPEQPAQDAPEEDAAQDDAPAEDAPEDEVEASADVTAVDALAGVDLQYGSCHEASEAGGNSDGVARVRLDFDSSFVGTDQLQVRLRAENSEGPVEVDAATSDGVTWVGLLPLNFFGEQVTVLDLVLDDQSVPGFEQQTFEVLPESDCTGHPTAG